MSITNNLWTEKYRPKTLDDMILPSAVKTAFISNSQMPVLLYGSPGNGKTSLAKVLMRNRDSMFINCSVEPSVETLRTNLITFCSNASFMDEKLKIVIFDEFEGVSAEYFKALRGVMDTYSKTTTFIATTNYINKIPESVASRFEKIHFNFSDTEEKEVKKGYVKKIKMICVAEGLQIDDDALVYLLKHSYPDMRTVILKLQALKSRGLLHITLANASKNISLFSELFEKIFTETNDYNLFTYVLKEYGNSVDEVFYALGRDFPKLLVDKKLTHRIGDAALVVQNFAAQSKLGIDKAVSLWTCAYTLKEMFKK
jgi:DNA polymerase III delta prime subunit